jgi:DNA polymerase I
MNKTLIIDGHNYLYRSYYGIPSSAKLPNGLQVNAYYGFLSLLRKTYEYLKPSNIIVIFDSETGTKQKIAKNPKYKENREYSDTGIFEQLPIIKQALDFMNISYMEHPDYEADDIIGSIAKKESLDSKVYISSQDRDFFQVIDESISVLRTEKGKIVEYNNRKFKEKYGFNSNRYLEYISLLGDPSDNIKGVKGIGKKTAFKIISEQRDVFKVINNPLLLENIDLVKNNIEFLRINSELALKYIFSVFSEEKLLKNSNEILKGLNMYD